MPIAPIWFVSVLLHAWVGWRLGPALSPYPLVQLLLCTLLLACAVLMPMGLLARRVSKGPMTVLLTWLGLLCMGLFSTLFVLTVLRDTLLLLAWVAGAAAVRSGWALGSIGPLPLWSAAAVPVLGLGATVWGFWGARRTALVRRVDVPIAGLPAALHGFSIAQISDIHLGPTIGQGYLERIVARVNALGVDMVAITGDLVDGRVADLQRHVAPIAGLTSTHGSFFVTGNHEYYSGAHAWIVELRRLGVQVLLNEHVLLRHDGGHMAESGAAQRSKATMVVAGVADYSAHHFDQTHRSDPLAAITGAPPDVKMRLLLAHQPRSAWGACEAGFQLQLSGHTHGGQFWPWMHFVKLQQPFTAGLNRLKDLWVYTNRGTGYWGPPKRFGVPSEITHLRLIMA
ncbi:MAG: metallophosphoesterase [Betaproteobacteria bacterium]